MEAGRKHVYTGNKTTYLSGVDLKMKQSQRSFFLWEGKAEGIAAISAIDIHSLPGLVVELRMQHKEGSLRKHDVEGSENVIWKCNFSFP